MSLEAPINRFEHREMIDRVHKGVKEKFDQDRINLEHFDLNSVTADLAYVKRMEEEFKIETDQALAESKKLADILEFLIYFHGEQSSWLGGEDEGVETIAPSRFDDIKNGVDVLVDFGEEEGSLPQVAGLGVDATTSNNPDLLFGKLINIKKGIEIGEATEVKYFEDSNFKGSLKMVPRIIVSADQATVIRLVKFLDQESGGNQALAEDKFQYQLLDQILRQCDLFAKLADKHEQSEIARKYRFFANRLRPVFEQKMKEAQEKGIFEVGGDSAHESLLAELAVMDRELDKVE